MQEVSDDSDNTKEENNTHDSEEKMNACSYSA